MVFMQYFSTQDHAAAALADKGIPVLRGKEKQKKSMSGVLIKQYVKMANLGMQI